MSRNRSTTLYICVVATALAALAGMGCSENRYGELKGFVQAHDSDVAATDYRIEPPDVITISSPTSPEVDGTTQRIRSDGKISLKLLGEVKVSQLTPREAAAKIEDLLARYYNDPKVNVRVAGYYSKKIYVFGQVNRGGAKPFTGRDTVMDAVADAGPTFLAWGAQVKVIRPSPVEQERQEITVNIDTMMHTGDTRHNFLLKDGDIVYVPATPLGWFGLRVREVLWPFSPVYSAYNAGANVEDTYKEYAGDDDDNDDTNWRREAAMQLLR